MIGFGTPNLFAYFALLIWPLRGALSLFKASHRSGDVVDDLRWVPPAAGGAEIKFQMVPAFNKQSIPNLAALIGCALLHGGCRNYFADLG